MSLKLIHIAGTPGSGKSFIGTQLKKYVKVIEIDDWTDTYFKQRRKNADDYENFIAKQLEKLDKDMWYVLVGCADVLRDNRIIMANVPALHKFFIDINADQVFDQYNIRVINNICKEKTKFIHQVKSMKQIPQVKTLEEIRIEMKMDYEAYVENKGYMPLSQKNIIKQVKDIIAQSKKVNKKIRSKSEHKRQTKRNT